MKIIFFLDSFVEDFNNQSSHTVMVTPFLLWGHYILLNYIFIFFLKIKQKGLFGEFCFYCVILNCLFLKLRRGIAKSVIFSYFFTMQKQTIKLLNHKYSIQLCMLSRILECLINSISSVLYTWNYYTTIILCYLNKTGI